MPLLSRKPVFSYPKMKLLTASCCAMIFLLTSLSVAAITENDYEILYGDFNDDGKNGDIYFHRLDTFVLIHGSISIPLYVASEESFVVYEGSSSAVEMKATKSELEAYTPGVEGSDYYIQDEDGDGYLDLSVKDRNHNRRIVTLFLSVNDPPAVNVLSSQPVVQRFTYDAMGRVRAIEENGTIKENIQYDRAGNRCTVSSTQAVEDEYCNNDNEESNSPPVAESIVMDGLPVGQPQTITIVSGEDPDGDTLVYTSVSRPSSGSAELLSSTSIRITPESASSITFTISDGRGGTDTGMISWTTACYNPYGC